MAYNHLALPPEMLKPTSEQLVCVSQTDCTNMTSAIAKDGVVTIPQQFLEYQWPSELMESQPAR